MIKKSGKLSCCGSDGFWFGNCGSAGDKKHDHSWHEGLQACKAQSQSNLVIGQQLNSIHQHTNAFSNGAVDANSRAVITGVTPNASLSAVALGQAPSLTPTQITANTSASNGVTLTNSSVLHIPAATTMMSASLNTSTPMSSVSGTDAHISTPAHVPMIDSTNPVWPYSKAMPSRGCRKQVLHVVFQIGFLSYTATLFNF